MRKGTAEEKLKLIQKKEDPLTFLFSDEIYLDDVDAYSDSTRGIFLSRALFVFIVAAATIPYFVTAGLAVDTDNEAVNALSPACIVALNLIVGSYGADFVWKRLYSAYKTNQEGLSKWIKVGLSLLTGIWPTLPFAAGAYKIGSTQSSKIFLATTITLSVLPFNFFSSYRLFDSGYKLKSHCLPCLTFKGGYGYRETRLLKMQILEKMQLFADYVNSHVAELDLSENGRRETLKSIKINLSKGEEQSKNSSIGTMSKDFLKWIFEKAGGVITLSGWIGYLCSVKEFFWNDDAEDYGSWIGALAVLLPTFFLAFNLGVHGYRAMLHYLGKLIERKEPRDQVFLYAFPKTAVSLTLLIAFLVSFAWADAAVLLRESCPNSVQQIFGNFIYAGSVSFNGFLSLEFMGILLTELIGKYSDDDAKIASQLLKIFDKGIAFIASLSDPEFDHYLQTEHGKQLLDIFGGNPRTAIDLLDNENREIAGGYRLTMNT